MFISQINSPFKHKEWNLNPHQDESKTKKPPDTLYNQCALGHDWLFKHQNKQGHLI